ncbi:MAG TPA: lysylphosphatidylglycerol synthase transmembrane domain-containing protein [Herpetosiphonaceae bacterium]|nr:lysylphosphatidylglycerol synthase transmembrane domain-containing protein [Herpetosiphonaceae bacterium]
MTIASVREEAEEAQIEQIEAGESEEVSAQGFSLKDRLLRPRTLISFGLAFAIILFVFRGVDINPGETWAQMRQVNPALYLLAVAVFYGSFPLRALRWRLLLHNAGFPLPRGRHSWASLPALTEYLGLSWFVNCIVPAKLGDAYRGYLLKHNGSVSFSRSFGTIFAERLLDMIVLFGLLVISGWQVFGVHMPPATRFIFLFGLLLVVLIIVGLAAMRYLSPFIRRVVPNRFERVYGHFEEGTLGSLRPGALPVLFLLTAAIWSAESMRLFLVIEAMGGLDLSLPAIMFVALTSSLLTTVPATPGGLGLVEGGIIGVLISPLFGVAKVAAGAAAILDRVINYWSIVLFGLILFLVSKRK